MGGPKQRVLLIDDEPGIIQIVGKLLELAGFEVAMAADGAEGLQQAQQWLPDAIILDLMLPKMNGFDVCAALKQDARTQPIPVIIFTARGRADEERCLKLGASAYLSKTTSAAVLIGQIKTLTGTGPA